MKPWESAQTVRQFQRMSGNQTAEWACKLIDASLQMLKDSIRQEHKKISRKAMHKKMLHILWG